MTKKYYNLDALYNFMNSDNRELVENIKVTSVTKLGFNQMEGNRYQINFKIITKDGYQNKLIRVLTNTTYLESYEPDYLFFENINNYSDSEQKEILDNAGVDTVEEYNYIKSEIDAMTGKEFMDATMDNLIECLFN